MFIQQKLLLVSGFYGCNLFLRRFKKWIGVILLLDTERN